MWTRKQESRLRGEPDEVFRLTDGSYHIVDYKTARITNTQDELFPMYEAQLNAYAFIAERKGGVHPFPKRRS